MHLRERISRKLERMAKNIHFLQEYSQIQLETLEADWMLQSAIERNLQVAIETVLDIGEMILAEEQAERPEDYRSVILTLGKIGILSSEFAESFSMAAGFRNILVHAYDDIRTDLICEFLQTRLSDFDQFARAIGAYLNKRERPK
ncbi:MAG: DUF86 domain-containing protein [Candidatus Heimdallarchaeota archaeon]